MVRYRSDGKGVPSAPEYAYKGDRLKKKYIAQGYVSGTHGVRGEVKMVVWCDDISAFTRIKTLYADENGTKKYVVQASRGSKNAAVVKLEGTDTAEDAAKLKGTTFYVDRDELCRPADRILICDLIGLPVLDADDGRRYGVLESVEEFPSSDIYFVKTENGTVQVPDVPQFIKKLTEDAIYIKPIEGMFE